MITWVAVAMTVVGWFGLGFLFCLWAIMGWAWSSVAGSDPDDLFKASS